MQFLQPCLLLLLQGSQAHGYALLGELERFGFNPERLDSTLVYRALREMEGAKLIESHWDEDSQGPRRRVYKILPEGRDQLAVWISELRRSRDEIDRLLKEYKDKTVEDEA